MKYLSPLIKNKLQSILFFYVVPHASWAVGLEKVLPRFSVVTYEKTSSVEYLRAQGLDVFCLHEHQQQRTKEGVTWSARRLLLSSLVQDYLHKASGEQTPHIIVFKSTPGLELLCKRFDYQLVATPSRITEPLEDKVQFYRTFRSENQLNFPPASIREVDSLQWQEIQSYFQTPVVVQFARGHAGDSTHFMNDQPGWEVFCASHQGKVAKMSQFIQGDAVTLNACITLSQIIISLPFWQIMNEPLLNAQPGGTGGNDYSFVQKLQPDSWEKLKQQVEHIGKILQFKGYRGWLGFDFVYQPEHDQFFLIEVNPRLVASTAFFTQLQQNQQQIPFFGLHILSLLGLDQPLPVTNLQELREPFSASQMILRNTNDTRMILRTKEVRRFVNGHLLTERDGSIIEPGKEYGQVRFKKSVLDQNGRLLPWGREQIRQIKEEHAWLEPLAEK